VTAIIVYDLLRKPAVSRDEEGYPSGLRGWFAKSLVWRDLEREFESPLLRQIKNRDIRISIFNFLRKREIRTPAVLQSKTSAEFGAVNEAKKSTKYFSERMNGGGFSRYLPSSPKVKTEPPMSLLFCYDKHTMTKITWNDSIRLALSDVDETIAEVYTPAEPEMINELASFLSEGRKLFMVTGGSLKRVRAGITDLIPAHLRQDILVSHCSGAEVWGFDESGDLKTKPFYSIYEETFTDEMKTTWRQVVDQLVQEFSLRTHPAQAKVDFWNDIGRDPLDVMLDDRGPQITFEVVNGIDLSGDQLESLPYPVPLTRGKYDLRIAIMHRAEELLRQNKVPVTPRLGGNFALDLAIEGVSKTTSIQKILSDNTVLSTIRLTQDDIQEPHLLEVWGDKFSTVNGGTDRHMSEAVSPEVRSIDFRDEDPSEIAADFNVVLWKGQHRLHHGLLEYLQSRHSN
jgi:hypothetical protein